MRSLFRVCRVFYRLLLGVGGVAMGSPLAASDREIFESDGLSFDLPGVGVGPEAIGVVVNSRDPDSVRMGAAYMAAHGIPSENLVTVDLPVECEISAEVADAAVTAVWHALPEHVQGIALAWSRWPSVVEHRMSITSAFALGGYRPEMVPVFVPGTAPDEALYAAHCFSPEGELIAPLEMGPTPWATYGLRPTFLLAGDTLEASLDLIHRSAAVMGTFPEGSMAAFVHTLDRARDVRRFSVPGKIVEDGAMPFGMESRQVKSKGDDWKTEKPLFFHFLGAAQVAGLESLHYAAGGVGDHLTSFGGLLKSCHDQTTVLAHLRQGASGSYGTVAEPGNSPARFPDPEIVVSQYLSGRTLLQAYWSSVAQPGYGLFVGDPLTRPFAGVKVKAEEDGDLLLFPSLEAGKHYRLWVAEDASQAATLWQTFTADASPAASVKARGADHSMPSLVHQSGWTSLKLPVGYPWTYFRVEEISEVDFAADIGARDNTDRLFADSNAPRDGFEYSPWYGWLYSGYVDFSDPSVARGWIYTSQFGWQFVHREQGKAHFFIFDQGRFDRLRADFSTEPLGDAEWSYVQPGYFRSGLFLYNYSQREWIRYQGYDEQSLRAHVYGELMKRTYLTRPDNSR